MQLSVYQSNKYHQKRYKLVSYIYYFDKVKNTYKFPVAGLLESSDNPRELLRLIQEEYGVSCSYSELIQIRDHRILLLELCGGLDNLVEVSSLIAHNVAVEYDEDTAVRLIFSRWGVEKN